MTGTTRTSEGLDVRRRRLLYHAWRRGTREMDLIIGRFADEAIGTLSEAEVDQFERLLEAADNDIYAWISGERAVTADHDTELFRRLRGFNRSHPGV
jgi:antitoxin CptB